MTEWNYQREEREEQAKVTGRLRCVIVDVEETESKTSGLPMIVVSVRPSGTVFKVKSYIVKNEHFNRNMTQFFDAFPEIGDGNFNFIEWIGCEGAAMFDLDDKGYVKVKYWIDAVRAKLLPAFEGEKPERQTVTSLTEEDSADGDLPF
jgi:hypothetical protein